MLRSHLGSSDSDSDSDSNSNCDSGSDSDSEQTKQRRFPEAPPSDHPAPAAHKPTGSGHVLKARLDVASRYPVPANLFKKRMAAVRLRLLALLRDDRPLPNTKRLASVIRYNDPNKAQVSEWDLRRATVTLKEARGAHSTRIDAKRKFRSALSISARFKQ